MSAEVDLGGRLENRAIRLDAVTPADHDWCHRLLGGPAGRLLRYRDRTPSPEVISADLWNGVYAQFVVHERLTGRRCGLVGLSNVSLDSHRGHGFAIGDVPGSPLVVEGFGLLCEWAFHDVGLERIFLETIEFNLSTFGSLGQAATVEGRLRNYEFWRGRYWDLFILSLTPASFDERFATQLERRRGAAPPERRIDDYVAVVHELWPLDSLGAVETLSALEETVGVPLDCALLEQASGASPEEFAASLLALARQSVERGLQQGEPLRTPVDGGRPDRVLAD